MGKNIIQDDYITLLEECGLLENEANAYISLLRLGPVGANEIAKIIGLSRTNTYRILNSLQEKGYIDRIVIEKPIKFIPVRPDEILRHTIDEIRIKAQKIEKLKELEKEISASAQHLTVGKTTVKIIHGRKNIVKLLNRKFKLAENKILMMLTKNNIIRWLHSDIDNILEMCAEKGVKNCLITEIVDSNIEVVRRFAKFCDLYHAKIPPGSCLIMIDDRDVVIISTFDDSISLDSPSDLAIWISDPKVVHMMTTFHQGILNNATDSKKRIRDIEIRGPTEETNIIVNSKEVLEKEKEIITSANHSITALYTRPAIEYLLKNYSEVITKKNIKIRLMGPLKELNLKSLKDIAKISEIRNLENKIFRIMVIDEKQAIVYHNFDPREILEEVFPPYQYTIFSNSIKYVKSLNSFLEKTWNSATKIR